MFVSDLFISKKLKENQWSTGGDDSTFGTGTGNQWTGGTAGGAAPVDEDNYNATKLRVRNKNGTPIFGRKSEPMPGGDEEDSGETNKQANALTTAQVSPEPPPLPMEDVGQDFNDTSSPIGGSVIENIGKDTVPMVLRYITRMPVTRNWFTQYGTEAVIQAVEEVAEWNSDEKDPSKLVRLVFRKLTDNSSVNERIKLDLTRKDLKNNIGMEESIKQRLDPKCWKGKHKEGTKIKGGVRVNNCVPNESLSDANGSQKFHSMISKITSKSALHTREAIALMADLIHNAGASYKEALHQASTSFDLEPARLHAEYKKHEQSITEAVNAAQQAAIAINMKKHHKKPKSMKENFADGKGPGRPGDSQRHGIPKHATASELRSAAHAKGRKGQLARWQMNMRGIKQNEGMAEGSLNEFADEPSRDNDREEEMLYQLAKMWWTGNEQQHFKAEKTLASMGISIDEDDPNIILRKGNQFMLFPMDDFQQGVAEGNRSRLSAQEKAYQRHMELNKKSGLPPAEYYDEIQQALEIPDHIAATEKMREINAKYGMNKDLEETAAWQKSSGKNKNGGLNKKGVASYRREHPGSKLQTAVTTKPSKLKKGSKASKRRKSFCARMKGMKKHRTGSKTAHDPNSRINKSLRKWHCESVEELQMMLENAQRILGNK